MSRMKYPSGKHDPDWHKLVESFESFETDKNPKSRVDGRVQWILSVEKLYDKENDCNFVRLI